MNVECPEGFAYKAEYTLTPTRCIDQNEFVLYNYVVMAVASTWMCIVLVTMFREQRYKRQLLSQGDKEAERRLTAVKDRMAALWVLFFYEFVIIAFYVTRMITGIVVADLHWALTLLRGISVGMMWVVCPTTLFLLLRHYAATAPKLRTLMRMQETIAKARKWTVILSTIGLVVGVIASFIPYFLPNGDGELYANIYYMYTFVLAGSYSIAGYILLFVVDRRLKVVRERLQSRMESGNQANAASTLEVLEQAQRLQRRLRIGMGLMSTCGLAFAVSLLPNFNQPEKLDNSYWSLCFSYLSTHVIILMGLIGFWWGVPCRGQSAWSTSSQQSQNSDSSDFRLSSSAPASQANSSSVAADSDVSAVVLDADAEA